ncbi:MAG: DUF3137 domain-containing protein [Acholeplasmataceae bacterium]|jgi:hypothetical protein|nr:DUF3137 domain-containing protein [Acholeplasmataceae bacterium]
MENLAKLEIRRQRLYQDYNKKLKMGTLFIVIALLIGLIGFLTQLLPLFIVAAVVAIVSFVFFGQSAAVRSSFRTLIKSDLITTLLQESFDNVYYDARATIPIATIMKTGMVKRPDRFSGEDYIRGTYKSVQFEVSDVDLKERVETRDSKGNVHVSYQTYFKGRWYIYKFERHFKDILKIAEGRGWQVKTNNLVKIETESIEFNKKFSIWASTQEYGFYHITSSMIEKLMELEKLHKGSILYYYEGNELHVGVNDRRDYMEISLKTPITEEGLKDFMVDINLIPAIINELRLDSSKFKNTL